MDSGQIIFLTLFASIVFAFAPLVHRKIRTVEGELHPALILGSALGPVAMMIYLGGILNYFVLAACWLCSMTQFRVNVSGTTPESVDSILMQGFAITGLLSSIGFLIYWDILSLAFSIVLPTFFLYAIIKNKEEDQARYQNISSEVRQTLPQMPIPDVQNTLVPSSTPRPSLTLPTPQVTNALADQLSLARNLEIARDFDSAARIYQEIGLYAEAGRVRKAHLEGSESDVRVHIENVDQSIHDSVVMKE